MGVCTLWGFLATGIVIRTPLAPRLAVIRRSSDDLKAWPCTVRAGELQRPSCLSLLVGYWWVVVLLLLLVLVLYYCKWFLQRQTYVPMLCDAVEGRRLR